MGKEHHHDCVPEPTWCQMQRKGVRPQFRPNAERAVHLCNIPNPHTEHILLDLRNPHRYCISVHERWERIVLQMETATETETEKEMAMESLHST